MRLVAEYDITSDIQPLLSGLKVHLGFAVFCLACVILQLIFVVMLLTHICVEGMKNPTPTFHCVGPFSPLNSAASQDLVWICLFLCPTTRSTNHGSLDGMDDVREKILTILND